MLKGEYSAKAQLLVDFPVNVCRKVYTQTVPCFKESVTFLIVVGDVAQFMVEMAYLVALRVRCAQVDYVFIQLITAHIPRILLLLFIQVLHLYLPC